MRRWLGLILKEVWQHAWVVLLLGAFVGFVQGVLLLGAAVGPRTITMLEAHTTFMRFFLPVFALALGHRLVARELRDRTHRFLEALPLRRAEWLAAKLGIGLVVLVGLATLSLALAAAIALFKEPLTVRWLALIFVRSQVFALTLWCVVFAIDLTGRWRIPLYLAVALLLLFLDEGTALELERFGPFELVGVTLVLERLDAPWVALAWSLAICAVAVAGGATLAFARDGTVAASLAERMSRREKVAVGVVLALALIGWDVADPSHGEAPFEFQSEHVLRHESARVDVLYLEPAHRPRAERLANALARDLSMLHERLGLDEAPGPVHVALRRSLDPHEYEEVPRQIDEDGVLVRADFVGDDRDPGRFDEARFRRFVLERVIAHLTDGRSDYEPHRWIAIGTAELIAARGLEPDLRAARWWTRRRRPTYAALDRLTRTEQRFGPDVARAIAASAAWTVVERHGEDAWTGLAREVLDAPSPIGLVEVLGARVTPARERFASRVPIAPFESSWAEDLRGPSGAPRTEGFIRIEREEGALRTVRWGVRFAGDDPAEHECALLHGAVGPFDRAVARDALTREVSACDAVGGEGRRLVGRYSAGDRVLLAVEIDAIEAHLRLVTLRRELAR